jgi:hypothetical protein
VGGKTLAATGPISGGQVSNFGLIAKPELESGGGLERRVALEAVRELLTASESRVLKALRRELDQARNIRLTSAELAELVSELLG